MKLLLILLSMIFGMNAVSAYELVLPKDKKTITGNNYVFFVGKAGKFESLSINDERIYIAPNGAFAHTIKLKDGENRILLKSNFKTQVYRVYREKPVQVVKPELIEFQPKLYKVRQNNTPLRSTPVDYGMNRLSHLFAGTYITVTGEKGAFYRVSLSKDKEGWIAKDSIEECNDKIVPEFVTMSNENFKNASKYILQFTENLPYTVDDSGKDIIFKVYNTMVSEHTVHTINIKKPDKYTYFVKLNNGIYEFKVCNLPEIVNNSLENYTIVVDAGHGGLEKGAIGSLGDFEKDINLKIALQLKQSLMAMGANVVMTRECDANVSLNERVELAKQNCADIFISIHLNSIPDIKMDIHKNRGTSVYYYNSNSKELAKSIEDSVTTSLGTRKDGIHTASFAVIRPTEYVGVLVETAYMTNPIDSVLYTQEDFPQKAALAIANGILNFLLSK